MNTLTDAEAPAPADLACNPHAVPPDQREQWLALGMQIYAAVQELRDLPDGYACRLPNDATTLLKAAEYVSLDRLCCAYVRWSLVIEPYGGPLWLHLTGETGTKEVIRSGFEATPLLNEQVALAAGFNIASQTAWVHPADPILSTANGGKQ